MRQARKVNANAVMNGDIEFSDYALETVATFVSLARVIQREYGMPCPDYDSECVVCKAWKKYNDLKAFVCD